MFSRARLKHDMRMNFEQTMCEKIHFHACSGLAGSFCTELNLFMCASFPDFSLSFEEDKLPPWPFFKGQFQLRRRIGAMAQPGSNPVIINYICSKNNGG